MDLSCVCTARLESFQTSGRAMTDCRSAPSWLSPGDLSSSVTQNCKVVQSVDENEQLQGVGPPYSGVEVGRLQG